MSRMLERSGTVIRTEPRWPDRVAQVGGVMMLAGAALGTVAFHVGLLAMGPWWWALPVLAVLVPVVVRTARAPREES